MKDWPAFLDLLLGLVIFPLIVFLMYVWHPYAMALGILYYSIGLINEDRYARRSNYNKDCNDSFLVTKNVLLWPVRWNLKE